MTFDAYTIYCNHCLARGQTPPTREWWDTSCKPKGKHRDVGSWCKAIDDIQFDTDTERREGWAE